MGNAELPAVPSSVANKRYEFSVLVGLHETGPEQLVLYLLKRSDAVSVRIQCVVYERFDGLADQSRITECLNGVSEHSDGSQPLSIDIGGGATTT